MRDGIYVVGQFLGLSPVARRDGSEVEGLCKLSVRAGSGVIDLIFFETDTDRQTKEVKPSGVALDLSRLDLSHGERIAARGVAVVKGDGWLNWRCYGVERADELATV